jgi:hypothetical protein
MYGGLTKMDSPTELKCLICKCRLINWTWDSMHCTLCLDKMERSRILKSKLRGR